MRPRVRNMQLTTGTGGIADGMQVAETAAAAMMTAVATTTGAAMTAGAVTIAVDEMMTGAVTKAVDETTTDAVTTAGAENPTIDVGAVVVARQVAGLTAVVTVVTITHAALSIREILAGA
eukprot:gb/GFBE01008626.1/.p1 GENE.gb/GFBE01008626.1/~~gb/GFBE01008626.1/.p1  ORF type:complete len:120 (+),score=15.86 gb/GFBE01008626.1/:1-360(+)